MSLDEVVRHVDRHFCKGRIHDFGNITLDFRHIDVPGSLFRQQVGFRDFGLREALFPDGLGGKGSGFGVGFLDIPLRQGHIQFLLLLQNGNRFFLLLTDPLQFSLLALHFYFFLL